MKDEEFDTLVVELCCPADVAKGSDTPKDQLVDLFRREDLPFAVDEYRFTREEIMADDHWEDWRTQQDEIPDELVVFAFISSAKNKARLETLFLEYTAKMEKEDR